MGKKLVIKGADFSANGINPMVDISELFSFENGMVYSSNTQQGLPSEELLQTVTSAVYGSCMVDLSAYVGKTITISHSMYSSSAGTISSFRCLLLASADAPEANEIIVVEKFTSPSKGTSVEIKREITKENKFFAWSYFKKDKQTEFSSPFYAYVE